MIVTVVIVDDHPLIRQSLAAFLKVDPQIEVIGLAVNGQEAIEKARELMPDVVIMDVSMPEMDGIKATAIIKQEMPFIRVIILTHNADNATATKALLAGADVCLIKGSKIDNLHEIVKGNFPL